MASVTIMAPPRVVRSPPLAAAVPATLLRHRPWRQHFGTRRRALCRCRCCSSRCQAEAHPSSRGSGAAAAAGAAGAAGLTVLSGAATMEEVYDRLADRVEDALQRRGSSGPRSPWLVGVAGVPGSGKSSLVQAVCARLNARGTPAVVVPMDGFHFFRRQLDQMPDPELAHARRGAEWTFDARAYHACLASIKREGRCLAPSFDHGVGDPRPGDIAVEPHHKVVLSEGNYLLLPAEPWWRLAELLDDSWYIDCCLEEAMGRVFARQVGAAASALGMPWWTEWAPPRASCIVPHFPWMTAARGKKLLLLPLFPPTNARRATDWTRRCPAGASPPTTGQMRSRLRRRAAVPRWWCQAPCRWRQRQSDLGLPLSEHACTPFWHVAV
ncbi:hypothetical protein ABPG75_013519 [Micractinium tetrahymenae]